MLVDKESQIKSLKENKEALEGKVKFLQDTCRRAGKQIRRLEEELKESQAREYVGH
jgi:chaperonin cofactor prefoldin